MSCCYHSAVAALPKEKEKDEEYSQEMSIHLDILAMESLLKFMSREDLLSTVQPKKKLDPLYLLNRNLSREDFIQIFKRMNPVSLARTRRSCKVVNKLVIDNHKRINVTVDHAELVLYPKVGYDILRIIEEKKRTNEKLKWEFPFHANIACRGKLLTENFWMQYTPELCSMYFISQNTSMEKYTEMTAGFHFKYTSIDNWNMMRGELMDFDGLHEQLIKVAEAIQKKCRFLCISHFDNKHVELIYQMFKPNRLCLVGLGPFAFDTLNFPQLCDNICYMDQEHTPYLGINKLCTDLVGLAKKVVRLKMNEYVATTPIDSRDFTAYKGLLEELLENWIETSDEWTLRELLLGRADAPLNRQPLLSLRHKPHVAMTPPDRFYSVPDYFHFLGSSYCGYPECYMFPRKRAKGVLFVFIQGAAFSCQTIYTMQEFEGFLRSAYPGPLFEVDRVVRKNHLKAFKRIVAAFMD